MSSPKAPATRPSGDRAKEKKVTQQELADAADVDLIVVRRNVMELERMLGLSTRHWKREP